MSRTRRRANIDLDINDMPRDTRLFDFDDGREYWENGHIDYYSKRNSKHDHKNWNKSSSGFKKVMKKIRKAKERNAMARGDYNNIPTFRKGNDGLYN